MNIDRALAKKLQATQRTFNTNIEVKEGGITLTADAATFELLKEATLSIFNENISKITDKTGKNIVQFTVRVGTSYTINIYTTTSRFLINGKHVNRFLESDLLQIYELASKVRVDDKPVNTDKLNQALAELIRKAKGLSEISIQKNAERNSLQRPTSISKSTVNSLTGETQVLDIPTSNLEKCLKCKRNCKTRSVHCTEGDHWMHYRCEGLST